MVAGVVQAYPTGREMDLGDMTPLHARQSLLPAHPTNPSTPHCQLPM